MCQLNFNIKENCTDLSIDQNIYLRILDKAITQTNEDIKCLKESLAQADIDTIQSISHRLKGDFANLRIDELSTIAKDINNISKSDKNINRMAELLSSFHKKFDILTQMVEKIKEA